MEVKNSHRLTDFCAKTIFSTASLKSLFAQLDLAFSIVFNVINSVYDKIVPIFKNLNFFSGKLKKWAKIN